jgi:hypothetical protein
VSRQHRDVVTSDALVRRYAEQLIAAQYDNDCGAQSWYAAHVTPPTAGSYSVTITSVLYGSADNPPVYSATCPVVNGTPTDEGTQLIRIQAQNSNGLGTQTLQIVKRQP